MKKLKRGGFSVVEAAIALTVVVIVSISALSVVLSSVNAKQAVVTKAYAQSFANSALESFKCHDPNADASFVGFVDYLVFAESYKDAMNFSSAKNEATGAITYTCTPSSHPFTAKIEIQYGATPVSMDTFRIVVTGNDGKTLAELSYEKPHTETTAGEATT